jgi:hypothetical protein
MQSLSQSASHAELSSASGTGYIALGSVFSQGRPIGILKDVATQLTGPDQRPGRRNSSVVRNQRAIQR